MDNKWDNRIADIHCFAEKAVEKNTNKKRIYDEQLKRPFMILSWIKIWFHTLQIQSVGRVIKIAAGPLN